MVEPTMTRAALLASSLTGDTTIHVMARARRSLEGGSLT
jgi:hypothetical protein